MTTTESLADLIASIVPVDDASAHAARERQDRLTKPAGSLGQIEAIGIQLAAIARACPPPVPERATICVFAGDHGVTRAGVTPWPSEVTAQMVANFCAGGAAINVLARHAGAAVTVVDVGVATPIPGDAAGLVRRNVAPGTANLAVEAAMTIEQARAAIGVGADVAREAILAGAQLLATGDMGIGNTTPSAALLAALTGTSPGEVTGRGTGIDDATWRRKVEVITGALARLAPEATPLAVLAEVGGLEIAALAGLVLGAASARVPVVIDGVIAVAAATVAAAMAPAVTGYLIGGHRSSEPGATVGLAHLGVTPLLDLGLRLGEGSGAALAIPLVQAAARIMAEMATFESAGVSEREA